MQEPRNSCVVTAKTKESDSKAVPAVATVVRKELWKKDTANQIISWVDLQGTCLGRIRLTENEDADKDHYKQENAVKDAESLSDVLHAVCDGFALLADLHNLANHLVQADVAIAIGINGIEAFVGLVAVCRAKNLLDIIAIQIIVALAYKRHPDALGKSLRGLDFFESFHDDGVSRVGVEDLLARDFRSHMAEDGSDLVTKTTNVAASLGEKGHGGLGAVLAMPLLATIQPRFYRVADDVVLLGKVRAVHGEELARGVEHDSK